MSEPLHVRLRETLAERESAAQELIAKKAQLEQDWASARQELLRSVEPRLAALEAKFRPAIDQLTASINDADAAIAQSRALLNANPPPWDQVAMFENFRRGRPWENPEIIKQNLQRISAGMASHGPGQDAPMHFTVKEKHPDPEPVSNAYICDAVKELRDEQKENHA